MTGQQARAGAQAGGQAGALWGGVFASGGGSAEVFRALNDSLPIDWRLVQQDIAGSVAWARALGRAGVLAGDDVDALVRGLGELSDEASALDAPPIESGAEDVHTWVEMRLTQKLGAAGKKLHTGRSRNDQVATDLRLWVREAALGVVHEIRDAQRALAERALEHAGTVFPAYTHLQRAQPVTFGHWCLAYAEMLERDAGRVRDAADRADECPLGCGALAGTAYAGDREALASGLGFARASANSLDAVSDRDVVVELTSAIALLAVHLSRLGEDLLCYASSEFGLVRVGDDVSSGSSLMPQKRNPDALELIRGAAGRLIALPVAQLTVLKGLPLSYNKDLQDDKRTLFEAVDTAGGELQLTRASVRGLTVDADAARRAASGGHANATDLADHLVSRGVPFREAHDQSGAAVRLAIESGCALEDLSLDTLRSVAPATEQSVFEALTLEAGLSARSAIGGTDPERVREAAQSWLDRLA